jgi:SAM-dependent methyltransferase
MTASPTPETTTPVRLNIGCGRNILPGWINIDISPLPGIDVVADLARCREVPLPFADDSVDEFLLSHVIEHVHDVLGLMAELHRIAKPGAAMVIRVPHGASDDAFEDPSHVRQMFPGSFGYFSQPYYWRADYGYRGDWATHTVTLYVSQPDNAGLPIAAIVEKINQQRNVVSEMVAELRAVKPIREPLQNLQVAPQIVIAWA